MFEIYVTAVFGILRWPAWSAAVYAMLAALIYLSIGYGWELPENLMSWNPIFANALRMTLMFSLAQCVIGYGLGRLIGFLGRRLFSRRTA